MKKIYKKGTFLLFIIGMLAAITAGAQAPALLNPSTHPKFVNSLPIPKVMEPTAANPTHYDVSVTQFTQNLGLIDPMTNLPMSTTVWGYNGSFPGPTFETKKNTPITVTWKNELYDKTNSLLPVLPHLLPVDLSIIPWANATDGLSGGVPLVTHLHGGHVGSGSDGNPDAWFTPGANSGIYDYPNDQEASTLWYHDHAMGVTRLNVYAGLAGYYIIRDDSENALQLPSGPYEIPIVIQDRMFTATGQLYYPSGAFANGDPSILPEMFGDFILVNGKTWPVLNVEPRKYRFRFLNGSDSRFYKLNLGIPFVQIGTEGGLLNAPVSLTQMILGPGERKDVIIDFSNPALLGQTLILKNSARSPFPMGVTPDPQTVGQIMAFRVNVPLNTTVADNLIPAALRSPTNQIKPLVGTLASPVITRELLLIETTDEATGRLKPQLGTSAAGALDYMKPVTEKPFLNDIEEWQIINFTPDAHPIHLHLVNYQIVSRQKFNTSRYVPGNPLSLDLQGQPKPPTADESGWKDTAVMYPGEVTRIRAKFDLPGLYVWHCHILSHEDFEMMRPFEVVPRPDAALTQINKETFDARIAPNPFSSQTSISMEIGTKGNYKADVYNMIGKHITTLTNGYYDQGIHDLSWNGTGSDNNKVDDGIYLLRIEGVDGNRTYKMLLNR